MSIEEQSELDMWTEQPDVEPDAEPKNTNRIDRLQFGGETSPDKGRRCENCGGHVTDSFARVFGPETGPPKACPHCVGGPAIRSGAAINGPQQGRAADQEHSSREARAAHKPRGLGR